MYHFKVDIDCIGDEDVVRYIKWLKFALIKTGQWNE